MRHHAERITAGVTSLRSMIGPKAMYGSADNLSSTPRRSISAMHRSKVTPAQSMVNLSSNSSLYGSFYSFSCLFYNHRLALHDIFRTDIGFHFDKFLILYLPNYSAA